MKAIKILLILAATLLLVSCQKEQENVETPDYKLMEIVQNTKYTASSYFASLDPTSLQTKSSCDEKIGDSSFTVPDWAYPYILEYLTSGDVQEWDANQICNLINEDSCLLFEQKEYIAQVLGVLEYIKDDTLSIVVETKSKEEDCLFLYKQAVKEILITDLTIGAIGGSLLSGAVGFELGLIGGLVSSWREIKQAGNEYIRCTA